jgi:hypothetical protein
MQTQVQGVSGQRRAPPIPRQVCKTPRWRVLAIPRSMSPSVSRGPEIGTDHVHPEVVAAVGVVRLEQAPDRRRAKHPGENQAKVMMTMIMMMMVMMMMMTMMMTMTMMLDIMASKGEEIQVTDLMTSR